MRLRKSLSGLRSKSRGAGNFDAPLQSASPARSLKSNPPISRLSRGGSARTIRLDLLDKSGVLGEGHKGSVERFNRGGASRNERGIDDLSCGRRRAWMGAMPNKTDRISLRIVRRAPSPKGKDRCR
jgi:hypothetical protein